MTRKEEVKAKAEETLNSVKELLKTAKTAAHSELSKTVPKAKNALDRSFDSASKGLAETLGFLDRRTSREQVELLRAYRAFLTQQIELIDKRLASKA